MGGGNFEGKGRPIVNYRNAVPWAVQKRLKRLRCLGCGLAWAQGSMCYMGGLIIGATWRIRLNRPCAAAMRTSLSKLWPIVI